VLLDRTPVGALMKTGLDRGTPTVVAHGYPDAAVRLDVAAAQAR
jgi:hypothetical protein